MKIAILTDSGSNLLPEIFNNHPNLYSIPLNIIVDGQSFKDQVEISAQEVYDQLDEKNITTSQPNLKELLNIFKKIKQDGYEELLIITISSALSGAYNAFNILVQDEKDLAVTLYDSKTIAGAQAILVERALELVTKGISIQDILPQLDELREKKSVALFTVNTLKYLQKGGRIGKIKGTVGDLLKLKPIVAVNEAGAYIVKHLVFGMNRAILKMRETIKSFFENQPIDIIVHYGNGLEKAEFIKSQLIEEFNVRGIRLIQLTPVLGIHTGPDMFALIASAAQ